MAKHDKRWRQRQRQQNLVDLPNDLKVYLMANGAPFHSLTALNAAIDAYKREKQEAA